jgi:murein DD-endopeptidase MepM/ murein hydrolase activator NlpD
LLGTSPVTDDSSTSSTTGTTSTRQRGIAARLRRHRGITLRAGAGTAVLLGVTAGITLLTGPVEQTPVAEAADVLATTSTDQAVEAAQQRAARISAANRASRSQQIALANRRARIAAANRAARAHQIAVANRRARIAAAKRAARAHQIAVANRASRAGAARKAAAAKQRAAAAAGSVSRVSSRDPRSAARALLAARGWSGQFGCLDALWQRESGWNPRAYNASSGAFGIPQALPGSKMASAGADWRTNPVTQIRWGLSYIASRYGSPCGAWSHSQATGWY